MAAPATAQAPYCGVNTADGTAGISTTQTGATVTCTYQVSGNTGGEFEFTVPTGVTQLTTLTATGAPGGTGGAASAGETAAPSQQTV